jgi:hypothetical protein
MNIINIMITEELPQRCEHCGVISETRPYGLAHEEICIDCSKKDEALTLIRIREFTFADDIIGDWHG